MTTESLTAVTSVENQITDPRAIAASIVFFMLGASGLTLLPLIVGMATEELNFSARQVGLLASIDTAGIAAGSVATAFCIRKLPWRRLALWGFGIVIVASTLSIGTSSFVGLCLLRFVAEFGCGLFMSLGIAAIGDTRYPDRYSAFSVGLVMVLSIGVYLVMPGPVEKWGLTACFVANILIVVAVLPTLRWFPQQGATRTRLESKEQESLLILFISFAAFIAFMVAEGSIWAFMERMGDAAGLSGRGVGNALAGAMLVALLGALAASWLSTRYGRAIPICAGITGFIAAFMLLRVGGASAFAVGLSLTQFFYSFSFPYLMLLCINCDHTGRYYVLTPGFMMAGYAAGPAIVSIFLTGGNYGAVTWVGAMALLLCAGLAIPLATRLDRPKVHARQGQLLS